MMRHLLLILLQSTKYRFQTVFNQQRDQRKPNGHPHEENAHHQTGQCRNDHDGQNIERDDLNGLGKIGNPKHDGIRDEHPAGFDFKLCQQRKAVTGDHCQQNRGNAQKPGHERLHGPFQNQRDAETGEQGESNHQNQQPQQRCLLEILLKRPEECPENALFLLPELIQGKMQRAGGSACCDNGNAAQDPQQIQSAQR